MQKNAGKIKEKNLSIRNHTLDEKSMHFFQHELHLFNEREKHITILCVYLALRIFSRMNQPQ